ncbi:hypothetical protein [Mesorhizobium sp. INR15]|uniref:hypothetical protein n=1 Tax=Mesorhizobium sp. INR15 TaxID=2654248 RepID=UPI0018967C98|nr:hypothetical protein [Mesorhizobium sp. INR15]QPC91714.1 hypothetical protein GA829_14535 [Mesorhizobium sp. INR15]
MDRVTEPDIAEPETLSLNTRRHYDRVRTIFEDENIIGAGIARKVAGEERTKDLSIVFYVRRKIPPAELLPDHVLPPVMAASNGRAVYTDVVEIGDIVPQANVMKSPLKSGFSVGHKDVTAGTLGAVVRKDGKRFLLSNSHVLANSGLGAVGDALLYPGPQDDGRQPADVVAKLSAFSPFAIGPSFTNTVDAALGEVDEDRLGDIDEEIWSATTPLKVATPQRDMVVKKRGRTSGDTQSVVRDVDFRVLVRYQGVGVVGFTGQVLCDTYTEGGDSGALIVAQESGAIVGLHFAGSPQGSVFTPIRAVMETLKFSF